MSQVIVRVYTLDDMKRFEVPDQPSTLYPGRSGTKDCEERVRFRELEGSTPDSAGAISVLFNMRNEAVRRRHRS